MIHPLFYQYYPPLQNFELLLHFLLFSFKTEDFFIPHFADLNLHPILSTSFIILNIANPNDLHHDHHHQHLNPFHRLHIQKVLLAEVEML